MIVTMYLLLNHEDHLLTWGVVWPSAKDFFEELGTYDSEYGTFDLRIRSEFYCSNDVIVGHISLPHYRETVNIYISFLF